jgi:fructose-bisphosphate aldolase class 1
MGDFKERLEQMRTHPGFIAALDQSGGSMPHAPPAYGIQDDAWSNEAQMFAIVHQTFAHHDQPGLHRGTDYRRHPVREPHR